MKIKLRYAVLAAAALVAILGFSIYANPADGKYNEFAKCISDKDIKMYGAFWCPHCQEQKRLFGSSQKYLNYVECSTPDGNGQTDICKNNQITSYPTWEMSDGTRLVGSQSFEKLAELSGCKLNP
jgi:glutaredoxin